MRYTNRRILYFTLLHLVSTWPGTSVPRWSPHPSLWCCSSPCSSTVH